MPKYRVTTDQGVFNVELDSEPQSESQLRELIQLHFTGKAMDETKAYQQSEFDRGAKESEQPAMVKNAVEPRPRDFTGHLAQQATEGMGEIKQALLPDSSGSPVLDRLKQQPSFRLGRAGLGAVQTLFSPVTAAARAAADYTGGELTEKLAPTIGAGPAAAVGTAVGTPIEALISGVGTPLKTLSPALARLFPGGVGGKGAAIAEQAGKGLVKRIPGAQAAQMEAAIDTTRGALEGKTAAATGRAGALQGQVNAIPETETAPLARTLRALDDIIADEVSHGMQDKTLLRDAKRLKQVIEESGGNPPLAWIDKELSRIGEKTKAVLGTKTNPAYKKLFGSMADDLEGSPSGLGQTIRIRDKALREQFGWEDLTDEFENLVKTKKGMEGAQDVNTAQLLNKLKRKDFLMESLNPDDWKDVEVIFKKIADMPALPPPKGVMAGSYRALTTGGGGAALATALGADPATAGIVGGGLMALERLSMTLLPSRVGRKLVRGVLESGPINKESIDILTAAANAMSGGTSEVGKLFKKKTASQ